MSGFRTITKLSSSWAIKSLTDLGDIRHVDKLCLECHAFEGQCVASFRGVWRKRTWLNGRRDVEEDNGFGVSHFESSAVWQCRINFSSLVMSIYLQNEDVDGEGPASCLPKLFGWDVTSVFRLICGPHPSTDGAMPPYLTTRQVLTSYLRYSRERFTDSKLPRPRFQAPSCSSLLNFATTCLVA